MSLLKRSFHATPPTGAASSPVTSGSLSTTVRPCSWITISRFSGSSGHPGCLHRSLSRESDGRVHPETRSILGYLPPGQWRRCGHPRAARCPLVAPAPPRQRRDRSDGERGLTHTTPANGPARRDRRPSPVSEQQRRPYPGTPREYGCVQRFLHRGSRQGRVSATAIKSRKSRVCSDTSSMHALPASRSS